MTDPYSVLGLSPGASEEAAKQAFRKLAKTCHPDLHPGDPAAEHRFKQINEAYDAIRNPQPESLHATHFRFDDFPFEPQSPFEELFAHVRSGFGRPQRNRDIHMECRIQLQDAFHGKEIELNSPSHSRLKVKIPPGIEDGMSLRMAQAGDHSFKHLPPGDLFLIIRVLPHSNFLRTGRNLTTITPVSVFDVLLGKEIEVIGIDGHLLHVAIPTNFDTSRKLRLAGQGMPDGNGRGDLLIELFVMFPPLSDEQRALVEQIAK